MSPKNPEIQERQELFRGFCEIACPDYLSKSKPVILDTIRSLGETYTLKELLEQAQKFQSEFPNGLDLGEKIDLGLSKNQRGFEYKNNMTKLIREKIGIEITASSLTPSPFYDSIIRHCTRT